MLRTPDRNSWPGGTGRRIGVSADRRPGETDRRAGETDRRVGVSAGRRNGRSSIKEWGPRNTRKDAKGNERCGLGGPCHVARPDIGRGRDALLRSGWDGPKNVPRQYLTCPFSERGQRIQRGQAHYQAGSGQTITVARRKAVPQLRFSFGKIPKIFLLPTSVAAPARAVVVARLPGWSVIISWAIIRAVKVRVPRRCAVTGPAVVTPVVIGPLAVVWLAIVALIEVVKQEGERKRYTPAYLGLSWALGCKQ